MEGRLEGTTNFAILKRMKRNFTAVIKQDEGWWIGWIEEVPGVNSQGRTRRELLANLRSALREAIAMNREDALRAAQDTYEEEAIAV
jgi:predicted RNase H-like HicB family nuclease